MSEQASTQDPAAVLRPHTELRTTQDGAAQPVRIIVLAAVCLGVAALAAGAFLLSYSGIHAVAIQAGISPQHARDYPVLIDAMLVIALLAVLGLRGAGLPSRILSWLALLAVLAAAAGVDVLHATGRMLRHTVGAATAAALPWALVFIAFVLLLALLRHARLRRQATVARQGMPLATDARPASGDQLVAMPPSPSLPVRTPQVWDSASIVPGFSARLVSSAAAGAAAGAAATVVELPGQAPKAGDDDPGDPDRDQHDAILGLAGADAEPRKDAESAEADQADARPADTYAQPPDADATPADQLAEPAGAEPTDAEVTEADTTPGDAPTELADHRSEPVGSGAAPEDPPAEPADAAAEPADISAAPEDPPAEPADAAAEPADAAAESDEPPAEDADSDAMAADPGSVETFPAPDESDDPGTSDPAADQGANDDVADNMPVFHRMWSTPTPPDS